MFVQVRTGLRGQVRVGLRGVSTSFASALIPGSLTTGTGSVQSAVTVAAISKQVSTQSTVAAPRKSIGTGGQQAAVNTLSKSVSGDTTSQSTSVAGGTVTSTYGAAKQSVSNASTATLQNSQSPASFATTEKLSPTLPAQNVSETTAASSAGAAPAASASVDAILTPSDNIQGGVLAVVKQPTFFQKYKWWLAGAAAVGLTVWIVRR